MAVSQEPDAHEEAPPVDVGGTFRLHDGITWRCTNIWIDEDGVSHVTLETKGPQAPAKVTYDDLRSALLENDEFERLNGGHQAWKWRQGQR